MLQDGHRIKFLVVQFDVLTSASLLVTSALLVVTRNYVLIKLLVSNSKHCYY